MEYAAIATNVQKLIAKYGRTITLVTLTDSTVPDPTKPWRPGVPLEATRDVKAVVKSFKAENIDDNMILTYDMQVIIPGTEVTTPPTPNDLVQIDGVAWDIINVRTVKPADIILAYILQIRQ
jgi:hypothetical protein